MLRNKEEAEAFAKFLAWEKKRHLDDILMIDAKLKLLSKNWDVNIVADGKNWRVNGVDLTESAMWIDFDELKKRVESPPPPSHALTQTKGREVTQP